MLFRSQTGKVSGLCARGGFEIAMEWQQRKLKKVTLFSQKGGTVALVLPEDGKRQMVTLGAGEKVTLRY